MSIHALYKGPADCPDTLPLFPLPGALLLPRGQMPLNIFEPRYLAMIDQALRTHRMIGMIQPDADEAGASLHPKLYSIGCAGRITQFSETGDGRYLITLTGVARFKVQAEIDNIMPYRQAHIAFEPYLTDFTARYGEDEVDREGVIKALQGFVAAHHLKLDWKGVEEAPNEALVNALCMMSPFGIREKQALLEAQNLKIRAEALIALTQIELARSNGGETTLQ
jgi:uncharacterized protein